MTDKKQAELYVGGDTELCALLDNVQPDVEYEKLRQICRKASMRIRYLKSEIRDLKEAIGETDD